MKKIITIVFICALVFGVFVPSFSVQAISSNGCIAISQDLSYGSTDANTRGDVSQLQRFLINQNLLNTNSFIAGTYDTGTMSAVRIYQSSNGLPATGTVDYATRTSISQVDCNGTSTTYLNNYSYNNNQNGCLSGYLFNTITGQSCSGIYNNYNYNNTQLIPGCVSGYAFSILTGQSCYPNNYNYGNTILPVSTNSTINIVAPTKLNVGTLGTWVVTVNNLSNNYNNYSSASASVRWGDENIYPYYNSTYNNINYQTPVYSQGQQVTTFTHTYQKQGTYTVTFTTVDSSGTQNTSSVTVKVCGTSYGYSYPYSCN